ncbi:MAG TPA: hypothetical protein VNX68_12165, partial [Nitrosopumilaceae archaeon]|nr:hypothetical protein [Nitrosopumilaceae archaeon]
MFIKKFRGCATGLKLWRYNLSQPRNPEIKMKWAFFSFLAVIFLPLFAQENVQPAAKVKPASTEYAAKDYSYLY